MRVSTSSFYEQSLAAMGSQQSNMLRVQQQLATMTKILAPSDDPLAAAQALTVSQSIAQNSQYAASRTQANQFLTLEESSLQTVTTVLQNIKSSLIDAGNGTLLDTDRASIAISLQADLTQLQGLANADDGNGQFLFAGFQSTSAPFVSQAGGGMQYVGDQGQRVIQVDVSRQMAVTDDGHTIFQTVQGGAGYVASAPGNTGSAVFGPPSPVNTGDPNYGKNFVISFSDATHYLVDTVPPSLSPTPQPYSSGSPILFGGLQISVSGVPAAGDQISVAPARNAGTDVFQAISDVITALKTPIENSGATGQAMVLNTLSTANRKITNAHENVLAVRSSVGARLQELDALGVAGDKRALYDKGALSSLQDLDYASAVAEFYQRQTALQASQQTFAKIQQISLFNYL